MARRPDPLLAFVLLALSSTASAATTTSSTNAPVGSPAQSAAEAKLEACAEKSEPVPEAEAELSNNLEEAGAPAPTATDGSAAAEATEIDNYRAAAARFRDRAAEFAGSVSAIVQRQYDREVAELRGGYERLVGKADVEERLLREEAITAHERFLQDHPGSPYTARRMFRLAELYFEESEQQFLKDIDEYAKLEDLFNAGKVDFLPEPPQKDYRRSLALYKRIIQSFPQYEDLGAVYYMLGYVYTDDAGKHVDVEKARETYRELLANVPQTIYRAQAYFRLADLYFEDNELREALKNYEAIIGEMRQRSVNEPVERWSETDQRFFELALYKEAWAHYKLNTDQSVSKFMELIDWTERREAATGREGDLKTETIRYLAIAIADKAFSAGEPAVRLADRMFGSLGERPWNFEALVALAEVLVEQARFEEAIESYVALQQRFPLAPEGPEFQNQVVTLYMNLVEPNKDAADRARVELTNRYGFGSSWYEANKNNKEAVAAASQYILESLQWVAYNYHQKAVQSGVPEDYLLAAKKYEEYLERYPFAKNAYELNFYLAECYFYANDLKTAIEQYRRLFGYPETTYRKDALLGIMIANQKLWKAENPTFDHLTDALANIKPELGIEIEWKRIPLTDIEKTYLGAVHDFLKVDPASEQAPIVLYDEVLIHWHHNRLPEARTIAELLIERYPTTPFAANAVGVIVDSYLYTGQLQKMRESVARFASMNLGDNPAEMQMRKDLYATLERQSLFKQGEIAFGTELYDCALAAFQEYYAKYGSEGNDKDSKNIDLVLYNLAQSYSKVGNTSKSNEMYELLLARFPHSPQAPATFWKMASNYERILELDKAVQYYEDILRYHPNSPDVAAALYNSAFLKIGQRRYTDAAASYERYHKQFPNESDAQKLLYRAAELHETAGDKKNAVRVYKEWLDKYGAADPDRWVETQRKLADFLFAEGKKKDGDKLLALIDTSYDSMRTQLGPKGVQIAAALRIAPILADFANYEKLVFTGDQEKDGPIIEEKAAWNVRVAEALDAIVLNYPDFLWQSAALYYKGLSFLRHAQSWEAAPIPPEVEADQYLFDAYVSALQQQAEPLKAKAAETFKAVLDAAAQKKRGNEWVDKAQSELNRVDPNLYPIFKKERSAVISSDALLPPPAIEELPKQTSALSPAPALRLAEAR